MSNSRNNWLSIEMRLYVAKSIADSGREIKCEKCGSLKNLEFHHTKYNLQPETKIKKSLTERLDVFHPKNPVTTKDIEILCCKCHRNSKIPKTKSSNLATKFIKGKRYCVVGDFRFPY